MKHHLKCWVWYQNEVIEGRKTFEVRSTKDRCFQAGDQLVLQGYYPDTKQYAGVDCEVDVLAVYHEVPGLLPNHALMSIRLFNKYLPEQKL